MKKIVKQVLGIDVAQKELVVCLERCTITGPRNYIATEPLPIVKKGFDAMVKWVKD